MLDVDNRSTLTTKNTNEYIEHIETIKDEVMKLYAHMYVRHKRFIWWSND